MDCRDAAESFSEHIDGALESARASALDAHLVGCSGCARDFAQTRAASALVRALPKAGLPAGFHARLEAKRLSVETPPSQFAWPAWSRRAGVAFAALAVVLVVRGMRGGRDGEPGLETVPPPAAEVASAPAPELPAPSADKSLGQSAARAQQGAPYGSVQKISNEQIYKSLQAESEALGIEPATTPAEAPRRSFMGQPGEPGTREQAESSIRELAAMRRAFEESADRPRGVAITGRTAPLLSNKDEDAGGPLDGPGAAVEGWSGPFASGVEGNRTIENQKDWRALWKSLSKAPAPPVDFARKQVVGVFLGPRPSGGYAVEIVAAARTESAIVVQFRESVPPPGRTPPEGATSPYALRVIERSDLPIRYQKLK